MKLTPMYTAMNDDQKAQIESDPNYRRALNIVNQLSDYGRECDKYEYGLPMYSDHVYVMVQLVLNELNAIYTN